jgi:membrane protease YdiL (CAAX protease family)
MRNNTLSKMETDKKFRRSALFAFFLTCGISIFTIPLLLPDPIKLTYRIAVCIIFFTSALLIRRKTYLAKFLPLVFAFFISSIVTIFEYFLYSNQSLLYWISPSRMDLTILFKVLSSLIVIIPIVFLTKVTKKDLGSIYLRKGKLKLGLTIGIILFLFFLATSIWTSTLLYEGKNLTFNKLIAWLPWILVFVFSNGVKEEIQFRGFFLKKYETFLGVDPSNLLQSMIFALAHIDETYSPVMIFFLFIVFLLGLAFGGVIQKTDSLIGSILFHAGTDIPVILGIFSNF